MAEETTTAAPTTTPAAPSTTAPAAASTSTTTDVKKPASFKAALFAAEKDASSASDPGDGSTGPAAATVLPTDAGTTTPANRGPVPYDRFSEVNTRMQAAEKRAKEIAWAEGLDQQTVRDTVNWRVQSRNDPGKFVRDIYDAATPEIQAKMRAAFGTAPAAVAPTGEPQPDLQTDTGQPVYSAKQLAAWQDWRESRQQAEFDKRLQPLIEEQSRGKAERDKVESSAKAKTFASTLTKAAAAWPGFTEHTSAIGEELSKLPPSATEAEEKLALYTAWMTVYTRDVLPTLSKDAQAAAAADMKTKALAGSAHPGRATTSAPTPPSRKAGWLRREATRLGATD